MRSNLHGLNSAILSCFIKGGEVKFAVQMQTTPNKEKQIACVLVSGVTGHGNNRVKNK